MQVLKKIGIGLLTVTLVATVVVGVALVAADMAQPGKTTSIDSQEENNIFTTRTEMENSIEVTIEGRAEGPGEVNRAKLGGEKSFSVENGGIVFLRAIPIERDSMDTKNKGIPILVASKDDSAARFVKWVDENGETITRENLFTMEVHSDRVLAAVFVYPGENDYKTYERKYEPSELPIDYAVNPYCSGFSRNAPSSENIVSIVKRAFETWDKYVEIELFDNNVEVTNRKGRGVVYFENLDNASGWAFPPPVFEVWIDSQNLKWENALFGTVLHEAGHTLGLLHPRRKGTVMSGGGTTLARGDILGLRALYGENALS